MRVFKRLLKNQSFWAIFAVIFTLLVAYGQTLGFYFWQDDSALIFKLQNPAGPAGSYGAGIIGEGAYKYLVTPFTLFYPIFGLNPFGYFFIGILLLGISAVVFYFFSAELFLSKKAGFYSTLIFAAGYIGSETMFRISNSWQTNFGLILALLSFWAYIKFARYRLKTIYYLLSLLLFYLSIKFIFIRSHSLVIIETAIDFIFILLPFSFSKISGFIIRQIPFWLIFYNWYLKDVSTGSKGIFGVFDSLLRGKIEVLTAFFATVGNVYIPSILQNNLALNIHMWRLALIGLLFLFIISSLLLLNFFSAGKRLKIIAIVLLVISYFANRLFILKDLFWYRSEVNYIAGAIGMEMTILIFVLSLALLKHNKRVALTLVLGVVIIFSQVFGYFIQYKEAIFDTTHRYLSYSFIGFCLIFGGICYQFCKKNTRVRFIPLLFIIGMNLGLGVIYQNRFLREVTWPTVDFFHSLKKYVPVIKEGALFHFDIDERYIYQQQFNNFFSVGSMPDSTALAIYYGVDRYDLKLVNNFDEILFKLEQNQLRINDIYSFYYGQNGLINTTETMRNLLSNGSMAEVLSLSQDTNFSLIQKNGIKTPPLTPMLLTIKAKIIPSFGSVNFTGQEKIEQTDSILSFLSARDNYYRNVKITSLSQWKYREIQKIYDNDTKTSWWGHRIYWNDNHHEQVNVDLGSIKKINRIIWTDGHHTLTPTSYTLDVSTDNKNWKTVRKIVNGPERFDGEIVIENFESTEARFVRMDTTNTLGNDSPSIAEFEVVESKYQDVDPLQAFSFAEKPFSSVGGRDELALIFSKVAPFIDIEATIGTDKGQLKKSVKIGSFNDLNTYEFVIPPGGTIIKDVSVQIPDAPVKIELQNATLQNLDFEALNNRGLIQEFIEN